MMNWKALAVTAMLLTFVAGWNRIAPYAFWWMDGHVAIAHAMDTLEECGVEDVDKNITEIAPSRSRLAVAGHVRTEGGTLPFFVQFGYGQENKRVPIKVTVGTKTLIPKPNTQASLD
jgi:hypothetical protein